MSSKYSGSMLSPEFIVNEYLTLCKLHKLLQLSVKLWDLGSVFIANEN